MLCAAGSPKYTLAPAAGHLSGHAGRQWVAHLNRGDAFWRIFLNDSLPGYASLAAGTCFLGGVQLICLGILGEYVGRIHSEVKGRPLFVVDRLLGFGAEDPRDTLGSRRGSPELAGPPSRSRSAGEAPEKCRMGRPYAVTARALKRSLIWTNPLTVSLATGTRRAEPKTWKDLKEK